MLLELERVISVFHLLCRYKLQISLLTMLYISSVVKYPNTGTVKFIVYRIDLHKVVFATPFYLTNVYRYQYLLTIYVFNTGITPYSFYTPFLSALCT